MVFVSCVIGPCMSELHTDELYMAKNYARI